MVEAPTAESLLSQQRFNLLKELGNAAQATQASVQRSSVGEIGEAAFNMMGLNTAQALPFDPSRGRNLNILV